MSPLQATSGAVPRFGLLSVTPFLTPISAIFRPVFFSVLSFLLLSAQEARCSNYAGFRAAGWKWILVGGAD